MALARRHEAQVKRLGFFMTMTHSEIIYQQWLPNHLVYQFRESRDLLIHLITRPVFDLALSKQIVLKLFQLDQNLQMETSLIEIKCWARHPKDVTWLRLNLPEMQD